MWLLNSKVASREVEEVIPGYDVKLQEVIWKSRYDKEPLNSVLFIGWLSFEILSRQEDVRHYFSGYHNLV